MRLAGRLLLALPLAALALAGAAGATPVPGGGKANNNAGFRTSQAPMLTPATPGASVTPLITVGETLPGGYLFEAIPDGVSLITRGQARVDVLVNHETSTVPFPYTHPGAPTEANQNDFVNAEVSELIFNRHSGRILHGSKLIRSNENYQRFCSNYLATEKEGFDRPILFTNEEAVEWVNRSGKAWPATTGAPEARQSGLVVARDTRTNQTRPIWGMGRLNHENTVPVPGFDELVVLTTDDTFTALPPQSQLYSYIAEDTDAVWNDEGDLWAFVSDTPGVDDYFDFAPGSTMSIAGHFVKVPKDVATGRKPDGTDMVAADKGYPPPPASGWARDARGVPVDGPQWILEHWGDTQPQPVFQFIRLEDLAYDRNNPNIVYLVDSGAGTAGDPQQGRSTNGRVWRMVLNPADPTKVLSLSILIEGDDRPVKDPDRIHQPDNIESTANSLLIQEDPGSSQQFNPGDANATTARIWRYTLVGGAMDVVARVDQSADEGPTDVDAAPAGRLGAWESSGIVDASAAFGPGAFLVTIQASTLWVAKQLGDDNFPPPGADFFYQREGGQLVLFRLPGT
jgi:hypothetical protein